MLKNTTQFMKESLRIRASEPSNNRVRWLIFSVQTGTVQRTTSKKKSTPNTIISRKWGISIFLFHGSAKPTLLNLLRVHAKRQVTCQLTYRF